MIKFFGKEPQLTVWKSETKRVIEELLMQETFSREECDRLIKIVNSRVVDSSTMKGGQGRRPSELRSVTAGKVGVTNISYTDAPDLCSNAVMEAKKWFKEKKVGSNSKPDLKNFPPDRNPCRGTHKKRKARLGDLLHYAAELLKKVQEKSKLDQEQDTMGSIHYRMYKEGHIVLEHVVTRKECVP
ncbi:unnamed protein product [Ilex paraguariensis]|uniref:Uncharacterized protein n=1 Tax=Ilex paraguariensis TaxID=185542 RepID=A0ABC8RXX5_9AQUA